RGARRRDRRSSRLACGSSGSAQCASDSRLDEPGSRGRNPREDELGVRYIAGAAPFGCDQQLPDAAEEAIVEDPEPGPHYGARAQSIGKPDARLKIVQVIALHKHRRISLQVVTEPER